MRAEKELRGQLEDLSQKDEKLLAKDKDRQKFAFLELLTELVTTSKVVGAESILTARV